MADAVLSPPAVQTEQRVILEGISWETYERLLADCDPGRGKRFTYDNGVLQIVVLTSRHEWPNRILASVAETAAAALDLPLQPSGSTTFKRVDLHKGFEPDSSFYIANSDAVDIFDLDLRKDPPPDLVVEVDIYSPALCRLSTFAAVGIPEVWRYDGDVVRVHVLRGGRYEAVEQSTVMPPLTGTQISCFLGARRSGIHGNWMASIREWVKANR